MSGTIVYHSNNSGGSWWLTDGDWYALEAAGWVVHWIHDEDDPSHEHPPNNSRWPRLRQHDHSHDAEHRLTVVKPNGDRWLGALARSAAKATDDPDAAIAEFESVANQDASDPGCNCCGEPHSFEFIADDGTRRYTDTEVVATRVRWSS